MKERSNIKVFFICITSAYSFSAALTCLLVEFVELELGGVAETPVRVFTLAAIAATVLLLFAICRNRKGKIDV